MRIKLTLKQAKENQCIPVNYQYNLSSFIFRTIEKSDADYSKWLHDEGYKNGNKKFKFFTFSFLNVPDREIINDRLKIKSPYIDFFISMPFDETLIHMITGLFTGEKLRIYDEKCQAEFYVKTAEAVPEPVFKSEMSFRARTPLVLKSQNAGGRGYTYIGPDHILFPVLLRRNLQEKYVTKCIAFNKQVNGEGIDSVEVFGPYKPKLIKIRAERRDEVKAKGYLCTFRIKGDPEVIKVGYETGFGCNNSLGFGYSEVVN